METSRREQSTGSWAWLEWVALLGYAVATAVAISFAMMIAVVLTSSMANAAPAGAQPGVSAQDSSRDGGLWLHTTQGKVRAPLQATDVRLNVTGVTVRAVIAQQFNNPSDQWLEGNYLFPLPEDAAVDHLRMRVGDRVVDGMIREKGEAQKAFTQARQEGRQTSLVQQERPNVFTTKVANIAPHAAITIEIEYQQPLPLKDGHWRLRLPTVVGPRYLNHTADALALAAPVVLRDPTMTDAAPGRVLSAVRVDPVNLRVTLDAGVPISEPRSGSHAVAVRTLPGQRHEITLAPGQIADRDFELEWTPVVTDQVHAALRTEHHGNDVFALLMVTPPGSLGSPLVDSPTSPATRMPRETTFIVDTSGSMSGTSIEQARRALVFGLERMQPGDLFNVIEFNSSHRALYEAPRVLDAHSRREAIRFANGLQAQGGTEMRGALQQALAAPMSPGFVRQIVFMTDGAVGYEDEMLELIRNSLGERRLFTIGIGSAPNSWFMRKSAEVGRGTFTHVSRIEEVERKMAEVFAKLAQPQLTDLSIRFEGAQPAEPLAALGDLYAGEPLIVRARFREAPGAAIVSGNRNGKRWQARIAAQPSNGSGLHVLWARGNIESLQDGIRAARMKGLPTEPLQQQVTMLGLNHHLITPYTSLVAVDVTPVRPVDAGLAGGKVAQNLPAGWEESGITGAGELAQGATGSSMLLLGGIGLLLAGLLLVRRGRASRPTGLQGAC